MDGVTLMARCQDDQVVRGQLAAHYPQARIRQVPVDEDPIFVHGGEEAWGMTLRASGPEYVPLRTFRDDDLLDPGSDPLIALMGALSELEEGERVLSRLLLRSLGPDWSQAHQARAHRQAVPDNREPSYTYQTKPLQLDGVTMAVLGAGALAALKGYLWVQDGEYLKASLLGAGSVLGLTVAGWGWWRWKQARSRVYDPILVREKVSRVAFDAELQVIAVLPDSTRPQRAEELLGAVAAAYRHFDHPAGARFKVSRAQPLVPLMNLYPAGPGLFGKRSVLGIREAAALWYPPGAGDETPLVERSGARALLPSAKGVRGGAPVGDTTAGKPRPIRFPEDLLRRHHLYVARTRMGKSTLMHHIAVHKMREKAAGRDGDAIVVVDPHADLVAGLLRQVPESLVDKVRLIDLADQQRAPGINLLDTRVFADRDRTADSVVRVARGLWEQWGPRMQSILEQTVKTLHEANEHPETDQGSQHTILDGLKLLSDRKFRDGVLKKVSDPYLLEWWARDFGGWHHQYRADALAPVQTRLSYYASSKRARAILGQPRSTIDLRETILDGGILLVSTAQGAVGRDVSALVGASLLNLVDSVIREQEGLSLAQRRGALVVVDEMQSLPGVDYESMLSELGKYGASFILATQSLAKLDDLSPTMRDTILANVGCLAVFQVAGKRRPPAGVGTGQGPGVRGRHRVPAGASLLRPGHRGDRADARLLHDGQKAPGRRSRRGRAHPPGGLSLHPVGPGPLLRRRGRPAEGERIPPVAGRAEPGQRRGRRHGDGMMRPAGCEAEILRALASMPFIDRMDLAAVSGWSRGAVYEAVDRLDRGGFCDAVTHATGLFPATERFHLTAAGLERLAAEEGISLDELVRLQPVSDRWRRILMERLDALASVYRLAAVLSGIAYPIRFRWYRAAPLDAAVELPDGRTLGIVRRGHTSDRSPFANRMWKLRGGPLPGAVLVLMPDPVRLRHARRMLDGFPVPVFLAVESEAVQATPDDPVWSPQAVNNAVGLRQVLGRLAPGGELPEEPESKRASVSADLAVAGPGWSVPDYLLPATLRPAEKRAIDLVSDWPWIALKDLAGMLGVSPQRASQVVIPLEALKLVVRPPESGGRLALTDRALALLARRDRTSLSMAKGRWSATPLFPGAPFEWTNVAGGRSRQLLRNLEHTAAVHAFLAAMTTQAAFLEWEVVQLDPPRRASRFFRHGDRMRSVNPDAFGLLRKGETTWPFFLEWERRAVRPSTMSARLAPYLRYYSSHRPTDDHGARPAVIIVFDDDIAQTHFLRLAREEMQAKGVAVPLWVSHRAAVEEMGPLGRAWRTPHEWESPQALPPQ